MTECPHPKEENYPHCIWCGYCTQMGCELDHECVYEVIDDD